MIAFDDCHFYTIWRTIIYKCSLHVNGWVSWNGSSNVAKSNDLNNVANMHSAASSNELLHLLTRQTQTREVRWGARSSGHWVVTSMFAQVSPKRTSYRQLKKTSNGRSSQLNQYLSYKPHSNFQPTWLFKILCVLFKWYFWQKIKKISMLVLGLHSKDRESTKDKASISSPKVNRGCPPLTVNRISADCVQISLEPQMKYIPLRVYHTQVSTQSKYYGSLSGLFNHTNKNRDACNKP